MEADYFIKMIEQAEQARDEEIERVETGYVREDAEEPAVENEWKNLQEMSNEQYL